MIVKMKKRSKKELLSVGLAIDLGPNEEGAQPSYVATLKVLIIYVLNCYTSIAASLTVEYWAMHLFFFTYYCWFW